MFYRLLMSEIKEMHCKWWTIHININPDRSLHVVTCRQRLNANTNIYIVLSSPTVGESSTKQWNKTQLKSLGRSAMAAAKEEQKYVQKC